MEPLKSLLPIARWFLRIAAAIIIYRFYFATFETLDFDSLEYFISFFMIIAAITLVVGGTLRTNTMTVLSGLVITGLSVLNMFVGEFDLTSLITNFVPGSLGFYFFTQGNKG